MPRTPPGDFGESTIAFLSKALDGVSDDIKREVGALIPQAANDMLSALYARYPYGAHHRDSEVPHMRDDMFIQNLWGNDPSLPRQKVRGPHLAYIWQDGTQRRQYINKRGVPHATGRMPAADKGFFERTAVAIRLRMIQQAQAILDRARELA